jgi:hypothetical protein
LEGLTGQQCASLLELAIGNNLHYDAVMLCTLPATQRVSAAALEQLLRRLLQPVEAPVSCDGDCGGLHVRGSSLMASLLALPAVTEFSPATGQGLIEAAVQAAHLPFVTLLAERLSVAGQHLQLSHEQLMAMLHYGVAHGDVAGITLLTATPAASHMSGGDLRDVLCAAMAPRHLYDTWQYKVEQADDGEEEGPHGSEQEPADEEDLLDSAGVMGFDSADDEEAGFGFKWVGG